MDTILVWMIVGVSGLLLARRFFKQLRGSGPAICSGCSGCPAGSGRSECPAAREKALRESPATPPQER